MWQLYNGCRSLIDVCMDVGSGVIHLCINTCVDRCIGMRISICVDMWIEMCTDMYGHVHVKKAYTRHVFWHVNDNRHVDM